MSKAHTDDTDGMHDTDVMDGISMYQLGFEVSICYDRTILPLRPYACQCLHPAQPLYTLQFISKGLAGTFIDTVSTPSIRRVLTFARSIMRSIWL